MSANHKLLLTVVFAALLQAAGARGAATLPNYATQKTLGVGSCASSLCHGALETWKGSSVLQNEYVTWSRSDKHHLRAYAILFSERSKEIARRVPLSKKEAHLSNECLDCHTHNPRQSDKSFRISDGVACEACHGAAEQWITSHVERAAPGASPDARHKDNLAKGLYPTENDVERARLCLSCHLGTKDKFVTHKIMAAGHPRMSFELDTFTQIGPAHFRIDQDWQERKGRSWNGMRAWAIGQAVASQQLLELLRGPRGKDGLFPELVLFDCHSCHHPMADKRNTAARTGVGGGFVRLNDSGLLMLRQIVRRVSPADAQSFAQEVRLLHDFVANQGDKALPQAGKVEKMIESMIPKINAYPFSSEDMRAILNGLIDDGLAGQYGDYSGAEQAVMAMQSVVDFMGRQGQLRTQPLRPSMRRLLATVAYDEKYQQAEFQKALRDLKAGVEAGAKK